MARRRCFSVGLSAVLLVLAVALAACRGPAANGAADAVNGDEACSRVGSCSPCGSLEVKPPFVNVSLRLPSSACPDAEVFVRVAPNRTAEAVGYVLQHCAPIGTARLRPDGPPVRGALPAGDYVLSVEQNPQHSQPDCLPRVEVQGGLMSVHDGAGVVVLTIRSGGETG